MKYGKSVDGNDIDQYVEIVEDQTRLSSIPLVSVSIVTFNHERYIRQAIESVLAQKVDFGIEIVVKDDKSDDSTRDILLEYQSQYPDVVRLWLCKENYYSQGISLASAHFGASRGKYIALLDGDDYWTDPFKLQRQAMIMEADERLAITCTNANVIYEGSPKNSHAFYHADPHANLAMARTPTVRTSVFDLALGNYICTPTTMFRNLPRGNYPDWLSQCPAGDWVQHLLHALHGDIHYEDVVTTIYRVHSHGLWSSRPAFETAFRVWNQYRILLAAPELQGVRDALLAGRMGWRSGVLRSINGYLANQFSAGNSYRKERKRILKSIPDDLSFSSSEWRWLKQQAHEQAFYQLYRSGDYAGAIRLIPRLLWAWPKWFLHRSSWGVICRAGSLGIFRHR